MSIIAAAVFFAVVFHLALPGSANTCWIVQEPDLATGKGNRWMLSKPGINPCDCKAFRLGGVNKKPSALQTSSRGVVYFNRSQVAKARGDERFRYELGCKDIFHTNTSNIDDLKYPFDPFNPSNMRVSFEVTLESPGIASLYLCGQYKCLYPPLYKIDFSATEVTIAHQNEYALDPLIIQPGSKRRFTVFISKISDEFVVTVEEEGGEQISTDPKWFWYNSIQVGIASTGPADWAFDPIYGQTA